MNTLSHNGQPGGYEHDAYHGKSRDLEHGSPEKDAYHGPGPADPYAHGPDGKPIVYEDEMRIAGEFSHSGERDRI